MSLEGFLFASLNADASFSVQEATESSSYGETMCTVYAVVHIWTMSLYSFVTRGKKMALLGSISSFKTNI